MAIVLVGVGCKVHPQCRVRTLIEEGADKKGFPRSWILKPGSRKVCSWFLVPGRERLGKEDLGRERSWNRKFLEEMFSRNAA